MPPSSNKKEDNNVFQEVKEDKQPQKEEKKGGLSSLLDTKLVNLDFLGPKNTNNGGNNFNSYW